MTLEEIVVLIVMIAYAIYRQTQKHEIVGGTRFKLAIIYGIIGLVVGGYHVPTTGWGVAILLVSLGLSIVVGLIRGLYTRMWADGGRVFSQGTAFTVSLFVLLVLVKFGIGTVAYFEHVSDDGGFGEVLLMIALMVAFQAEVIWRRAQPLHPRLRDTDPVAGEQVPVQSR